MAEPGKVKIRIPAQDLASFRHFELEPAAAESWVAGLPTMSAAAQLTEALADLNRFQLAPRLRQDLLETLRPRIDRALATLAHGYLNQPLVLPAASQDKAALAEQLSATAATAYTVAAAEVIRRRDEIQESNPARLACEALQRAVMFSGESILRAFQLYRPLEIQCWQRLHQLYALAEAQGLAELPVPNPVSGCASIKAAYLRPLLLACSKPNQLRQGDLAGLYHGYANWAELVSLSHDSLPSGLFVVDLDSDQPPLYRELHTQQQGHRCRYIDTRALLEQLRALQAKAHGVSINLGENHILASNVIDHLLGTIGGKSMRGYQRMQGSRPLEVCIGLASVHYHVAGRRHFRQVLFGEDYEAARPDQDRPNPFAPYSEKADLWQAANPGKDYMVQRSHEADVAIDLDEVSLARLYRKEEASDHPSPDDPYPLYRVQPLDVSAGGYCLQWHAQLPGDVHAGDLVALREEEAKHWAIAVVRWLSARENDNTLVGLELLSPRATAYGVRIHQASSDKSPPLRALLLPEIALTGQAQSLVMPRASLREGQRLALINYRDEFTAQLEQHVGSTGSFTQYEFSRIKELGDRLAQHGIADTPWKDI